MYDTLFTREDPNEVAEGQDFTANLNPNSLEVVSNCKIEPSLAGAAAGQQLSVRTARLLLRGSRYHAREAGVQPHRSAAGYLGENRKEI